MSRQHQDSIMFSGLASPRSTLELGLAGDLVVALPRVPVSPNPKRMTLSDSGPSLPHSGELHRGRYNMVWVVAQSLVMQSGFQDTECYLSGKKGIRFSA